MKAQRFAVTLLAEQGVDAGGIGWLILDSDRAMIRDAAPCFVEMVDSLSQCRREVAKSEDLRFRYLREFVGKLRKCLRILDKKVIRAERWQHLCFEGGILLE